MSSARGSFSARGSLTSGPLRVAVIGAQTEAAESAKPYTVYRTVVTFEGQCYERLLRYSQFLWFYKNLKFTDKSSVQVAFPKKKWSRKASLEDDVIEERQVKLNEIMKDMGRRQLTTQSEQCLMKLLKIGKYDDGTGRVSDFTMMKSSSFPKSERSGALEAVPEEEEADKHRRTSTNQAEASSTLVVSSLAIPTSNATTVLTEEERSVIGSQPRAIDLDHQDTVMAEQDAIPADARAATGNSNTEDRHSRSVPHKSMSSIPPSPSSDMMLNRPQVKATHSLPPSGHSKPELSGNGRPPVSPVVTSAPETSSRPAQPQLDGTMSPEKKYRDRISTQLSAISRLLSEAETEDMDSARSIQTQPSLPLTA